MAQNLDELKDELYKSFNLAQLYAKAAGKSVLTTDEGKLENSSIPSAELVIKSLATAAEMAKAIISLEETKPAKPIKHTPR